MRVLVSKAFEKEFKKLRRIPGIEKSVFALIDECERAKNPSEVSGLQPLTNSPYHKYRIGQHRVILFVMNSATGIQLLHIFHRREAYDHLERITPISLFP